MRIIIAANGELSGKISGHLADADMLIACDGASKELIRREIIPDIIIGDLDSIDPAIKELYQDRIIRVACQETNDMTKALNKALEFHPDTILFFGLGGKREDHTIANFSLLCDYKDQHPEIGFSSISDYTTAIPLLDSCTLETIPGQALSIISMDPTLEITSDGLQYPTDGIRLDRWWKATLNRIQKDRVSLQFNHPAMCLVFIS